ncbi:MAG: ABC transporter substrate-binding protein [Gemmatimonadetes bacterium]|nr:ABC transporter substrate-binding protein [Gemmatimonadota bacterium]
MPISLRSSLPLLMLTLLAGWACGPKPCSECDTLVIVAVGQPSGLLPPLVFETVGRDISDRIFERLADLPADGSPLDPADYRPALAERWERIDDRRWRFHLRQGVTWHDGEPFTAEDVRFSFEMFSDPMVDALALASIQGITVEVVDGSTVDIVFPSAGPEQLYDATYHVRIVPSHIWGGMAPDEWLADTATSRIIGTGPYRLTSWDQPISLRLDASGMNGHRPAVNALVWNFQSDPDAAANLLLSHAVDVMEAVPPPRQEEVAADPEIRLVPYASAVYGFLAFNLDGRSVLGRRAVRRALARAVDREVIAPAVVGPGTAVPKGPMSRLLWVNDDGIAQLSFDTAAARVELVADGWILDGTQWERNGTALAFDILVPSTSRSRQLMAEALQEAWRLQGVRVTITSVDFPVFLERLRERRFDSYLGAFLDEPSARGLADQWTTAGWDMGNYGRYANPVFDSLALLANATANAADAKRLWVEALSVLNEDAPAIFLFTPVNVAGVNQRIEGVTINPYAWLEDVATWGVSAR